MLLARPFVGVVMRDRILSSVDLPAPLPPMRPTTSPRLMSHDTSSSAQMCALCSGGVLLNDVSDERKNPATVSRSVSYCTTVSPTLYGLARYSTRMTKSDTK